MTRRGAPGDRKAIDPGALRPVCIARILQRTRVASSFSVFLLHEEVLVK